MPPLCARGESPFHAASHDRKGRLPWLRRSPTPRGWVQESSPSRAPPAARSRARLTPIHRLAAAPPPARRRRAAPTRSPAARGQALVPARGRSRRCRGAQEKTRPRSRQTSVTASRAPAKTPRRRADTCPLFHLHRPHTRQSCGVRVPAPMRKLTPHPAVTALATLLALAALVWGALGVGTASAAPATSLQPLAPAQQHYLTLAQHGVAQRQSPLVRPPPRLVRLAPGRPRPLSAGDDLGHRAAVSVARRDRDRAADAGQPRRRHPLRQGRRALSQPRAATAARLLALPGRSHREHGDVVRRQRLVGHRLRQRLPRDRHPSAG